MKKAILAIAILFCTAATMSSCNNGAYDADPLNVNGGSNPLGNGGGGSSKFDWGGIDPFSAKIDGTLFKAIMADVQTQQGQIFISGDDGKSAIFITLPDNTATGSVSNFTNSNPASYGENVTVIYSTGLGGSGAVKLLENDATHIKGLFYFTGKSSTGSSKTISEGYFNIKK